MDWEHTIRDIEDRLFPSLHLDVWERVVYYHLLRRSRVEGLDVTTIGILLLAEAVGVSETRIRETIRALHDKGCVRIEDRSAKGHTVRLLLPAEIPSLAGPLKPQLPQVEEIDFYTNRKHVVELLAREKSRCFYCLRVLTVEQCALDHVSAQANGADHSFRNVVASCQSCNSLKQGEDAEAFLRSLYQRGVLGVRELEERLVNLASLRLGQLVPQVAVV